MTDITKIEPAITAQQFAQWCRATADMREASWHDLSWQESAKVAGVPEPWAEIIAALLFHNYADAWDWVEKVDPQ